MTFQDRQIKNNIYAFDINALDMNSSDKQWSVED